MKVRTLLVGCAVALATLAATPAHAVSTTAYVSAGPEPMFASPVIAKPASDTVTIRTVPPQTATFTAYDSFGTVVETRTGETVTFTRLTTPGETYTIHGSRGGDPLTVQNAPV